MAATITVTIDTKAFEGAFSEIAFHRVPSALAMGSTRAIKKMMEDVVEVKPTAPLKYSLLWDSGSYFTHCMSGRSQYRNRLSGFSPYGDESMMMEASAHKRLLVHPTSVIDENFREGEVGATLIFNAPYAALWHEQWPPSGKFRYNPAGIKYMERKLIMFWEKYILIIAEHFAGAVK